MSTQNFDAWAIVELFGHQRCAGRISEQALGGETFIRVDIPRQSGDVYTRLFGKGAIYCINICEEATARAFATRMSEPLAPYTALPAPSPQAEPAEALAGRYGAEGGGSHSDRADDDTWLEDEY